MLAIFSRDFSPLVRCVFAIVTVIVFFLCAALQPLLGEGRPFMLYYPAIIIAACSADYGQAFSPLS